MADFFTELEEDLREERLITLWHKYGNYIIGLALAIIIGTVGHTLWGYFKNQSQLRSYETFSQAVHLTNQGKQEEALLAFQDLAKEGSSYGKLAQLYEAALTSNPQDLYSQISQENTADPAIGNLAKILLAERSLDNPQALTNIEPLTVSGNAWAPLALELLALADLKKGDEVKAAKNYIKILKAPYATSTEQMRAGRMLSQLDVPPSLLEEDLKKESMQ